MNGKKNFQIWFNEKNKHLVLPFYSVISRKISLVIIEVFTLIDYY